MHTQENILYIPEYVELISTFFLCPISISKSSPPIYVTVLCPSLTGPFLFYEKIVPESPLFFEFSNTLLMFLQRNWPILIWKRKTLSFVYFWTSGSINVFHGRRGSCWFLYFNSKTLFLFSWDWYLCDKLILLSTLWQCCFL